MFSSLWRRLLPSKRQANARVILYTRKDCHLCDDAWELLQEVQQRHGFTLESVDIDGSPLAKEYGQWVPVVTVNGKLRFRGTVNRVLLQRLFDSTPANLF